MKPIPHTQAPRVGPMTKYPLSEQLNILHPMEISTHSILESIEIIIPLLESSKVTCKTQ